MKPKKGKMKKLHNSKVPANVIALYNFDPLNDEIPSSGESISQAQPDVSVLLKVSRGDKLAVMSESLDWWLMCKSTQTGKEGYVFSTLTAPFSENRYASVYGDFFVNATLLFSNCSCFIESSIL